MADRFRGLISQPICLYYMLLKVVQIANKKSLFNHHDLHIGWRLEIWLKTLKIIGFCTILIGGKHFLSRSRSNNNCVVINMQNHSWLSDIDRSSTLHKKIWKISRWCVFENGKCIHAKLSPLWKSLWIYTVNFSLVYNQGKLMIARAFVNNRTF